MQYSTLPGAEPDHIQTSPVIRDDTAKKRITPLPKLIMLAIGGIRSSEPFFFYVTFPFINQMLLEYGIGDDARTTGYYAGVLGASIMLGSAVSVMAWSHLSDNYGRRPVLIYATLATIGVGTTLGFPRSFVALLILRTLVGLLNGQCGTIKNYISEICDDETNEASAFALQSLAWQFGWCLSAMAGGYLAHAERTFPTLASWPLVRHYPYALPFLAVAVLPLLGTLLGLCVLPETRPPQHRMRKMFKLPSIRQWTADMWRIMRLWCMMVLVNTAFQALAPLFLFAPVEAGGLDAPSATIGLWYAVRALLIMAVEAPIYPRVHRRFGRQLVFKVQVSAYPLCFALFPIINILQYKYGANIDGADFKMALPAFIFFCLMSVLEVIGQTMFISGDLLCTNAGPTPELRSEYNAMVEWVAKVLTTLSVWLSSGLFAFAAETQICGGYLAWIILVAFSSYFCWTVYTFEDPNSWRDSENDGEGELLTGTSSNAADMYLGAHVAR